VTEKATPLRVGQVLHGQTVGTAEIKNGYVIETTEGVEATLVVDELSGEDLPFSVAVWRGTRRDNPPAPLWKSAYGVPIVLHPDQQYVAGCLTVGRGDGQVPAGAARGARPRRPRAGPGPPVGPNR
jgi:hypothetical protein